MTVALMLLSLTSAPDAAAQNRDFQAERIVIDDAAGDGGFNTATLQVPPTGLTANRTITFPDADGTVGVLAGPVTPDQILFGGASGNLSQSANLLWNNGTGIFNIGAGNFTIDAATGNVASVGNIQADGTIQSGASIIIDGTTPGSHNITATGGENLTITPTGGTLFVNAPVFNLGPGVLSVDPGTLNYNSGLFTVNPGTLQYGSGLFTVDPGSLSYNAGLFSVDPGTLNYSAGLLTVTPGALTYNGPVVSVPGTLNADPATFSFSSGLLVGNPGGLNYNSGLFTVNPGTLGYNGSQLLMPGILDVNPSSLSYLGGLFTVDPLGPMTFNGNQFLIPPLIDLNAGGLDLFTSAIVMDPSGNISTQGVITTGNDATPTPGQIIFHDNTAANGFTGTLQTTNPLTANRTYTFPDADGTLALVGDIVTDASLTGDGSSGNPLGIDLTNANSWTGAQTFSSVDINGGTIDGTTIGATTPAAGTFTTISDGAGTTIAGGTVTATTLTDGIASMSGGTISDGFGASMFGGTVTGFTLTDGIASMSGGTISDGFGASMFGGTVTAFTLTDGIASMSGGTISDGFGASMNGGTVTGSTVTDGIASMSGGTISDGAGSTITGGSGTFATITGTALPAASTSTDLVTSNGGALETRTVASLTGSIGVSSDATLTGDGTTGTPLGIDLANANSWTGAQTFSSVDINGGTIDGTTIGAATPAAGTFTTITATTFPGPSTSTDLVTSDAGVLETRTVASLGGLLPVTTDAATLTGDGTTGSPLAINLANANTWTGTQTFADVNVNGGTALGDGNPGDATTVNTEVGTDLVLTEGGIDRSSGATETFDLDNPGAGDINLLINGAASTTNSRLTVNEGHWTSEQATPPTAVGDGSNFAAGVTVSANSTDVAGSVSATDNNAVGVGTISVTFDAAYSVAPYVTVTPANANAATATFYISNVTTTGFDINLTTTAGDGTSVYDFHYQVIEGI